MARGVFSTTNYFQVSSAIITATPLTMVAWIKAGDLLNSESVGGIFYTSAGSGTQLDGWLLRTQATSGLVTAIAGNGSSTAQAQSSTGITAGTWACVAAEFASATSRYARIDGVAGSQNTTNISPSVTPDKTGIGAFIRENNSKSLPGLTLHIAEVGFWNVSLNDAEHAALAKGINPLLIRPNSLVAYYPLLRGDSSGDEPNPKNASTKMVEQGTVSVQPHSRIIYSFPKKYFFMGTAGWTALTASAGSFTLTRVAAGLVKSWKLTADVRSYTLTSNTATLSKTYSLTATTASFTVTGNTISLVKSSVLSGGIGAFTYTGIDAGLKKSWLVAGGIGSFAFTGKDAGIRKASSLSGGVGAFTLTSIDAGLKKSSLLTASTGTFAFTGNDATLTKSGGSLAAEVGSFTFIGNAATLTKSSVLTAGIKNFTLTGNDTGLIKSNVISADTQSYILTGISVSLNIAKTMTASAGAFTLTGTGTGLVASKLLSAGTAAFTETGISAGLIKSNLIQLIPASFILTGNDVTLDYGSGLITLSADTAGFTVVFVSAALSKVLPPPASLPIRRPRTDERVMKYAENIEPPKGYEGMKPMEIYSRENKKHSTITTGKP